MYSFKQSDIVKVKHSKNRRPGLDRPIVLWMKILHDIIP